MIKCKHDRPPGQCGACLLETWPRMLSERERLEHARAVASKPSKAKRAARARRTLAPSPNAPILVHGRRHTYTHHKCRCEACFEGQRAANRRRYL